MPEIWDGASIKRLTEFAEELEARAAALESAPQIVSHDQAADAQRSDPGLKPAPPGD